MSALVDLTGKQFGKVIVLKRAESRSKKFCMVVSMFMRKRICNLCSKFKKRINQNVWLWRCGSYDQKKYKA